MKNNNRIIKLILYSVITFLICNTTIPRHHGHHHHGGGWGYYGGWRYPGLGWGYPGWGYGWGYGAPGITIGFSSTPKPASVPDNRDATGATYWTIYNSTDVPILARPVEGADKRIMPREERNIYRKYSFKLTIKSPDGQRLDINTQDHSIEVIKNQRGKIIYRSWN